MKDKDFCKIDTEFYGEEVDHIDQVALRRFNGKELKEYVEFAIKQVNGVEKSDKPALNMQNVMPRFSKEPLHISRGARTLNIKGFDGLKKEPTATVTCVEQWDDDGTGLYDESDDNQWATFYLRGEDIDPIINKLLEIKGFLNGA